MVLHLLALQGEQDMESGKNDRLEQNSKKVSMGVIALAAVSLLAGASVAATLEEYAAPVYAEADPFEGAVDDVTGEDTWQEKETDGKPMGKYIRKAMKSRMNDRMEDRTEHLDQRIAINSNLIEAFQFCLESADCTADADSLSTTIEKLTWAVEGMQAKVDGTDSVDDEIKADKADDYQICIREEDGVVYYDCGDKEFKDWDERKHWDETERMEFAEEKFTQLRAAQEAIVFCLESENCLEFAEEKSTQLRRVQSHMLERSEHHRDCAEDRRCHRDHDERQGFRGRMGNALCKLADRCEDRGMHHAPPSIEITQEMCESRMGVWTEAADRGDGVFYCDWSELEEGPEREDDSRDDDRGDEEDSPR